MFVESTGLPYIASSLHIAAYLGVSPKLVRQVLHKPSYHYRFFEIRKKVGKPRQITTPKTYLKVIQWWICDNILDRQPLHECVHGFRRGRSYVSNANVHFGQSHFLNIDIESFFPSISSDQVEAIFLKMGYPLEGAKTLRDLVTLGGTAPTGSPTSPMIANLVLTQLDEQLFGFAEAKGYRYTRYADDITFSSLEWIEVDVLDDVRRLVEQFGFKLNAKKTKFMGEGDRQEVTGLVINSHPNMPRDWRNTVRGYLHRVVCSPEQYVGQHAKVQGFLGTLLALDPQAKLKITRSAQEAVELILANKGKAGPN